MRRIVDLESIQLEAGDHAPDSKYCVMELVAYVSGEPWSDHPECVSSVIATFLRSWNDSLNDEDRNLLKQFVEPVIDTVGTEADEQKRAWMCVDWMVRVFAPEFLRLAKLTDHADKLALLPELTNTQIALEHQATIAAARAAAGDAAGAAAGAAAWAAAGAAAGAALEPTVKALQVSAHGVFRRMIAA